MSKPRPGWTSSPTRNSSEGKEVQSSLQEIEFILVGSRAEMNRTTLNPSLPWPTLHPLPEIMVSSLFTFASSVFGFPLLAHPDAVLAHSVAIIYSFRPHIQRGISIRLYVVISSTGPCSRRKPAVPQDLGSRFFHKPWTSSSKPNAATLSKWIFWSASNSLTSSFIGSFFFFSEYIYYSQVTCYSECFSTTNDYHSNQD